MTKPTTSPAIRCAHAAVWPLKRFAPNPRNPNTHPPEQLRLLAKVIVAQGWRSPIVVSRLSGLVVKGHGRLAAAKLAGLTSAPVDLQDYATAAEETADLIADNQLAELSEIDATALDVLISELKVEDPSFDLELAGIDLSAVVAQLDQLEMPASVANNVAEIDKYNAMRRAEKEKIANEGNTEKFLIVVFASLQDRVAALKRLGLPDDERYIPISDIKLTRRTLMRTGQDMPKMAAKNKTGATG